MNRIKTMTILAALGIAALSCTPKDENAAVKDVAVKANLTLGNWYKADDAFKTSGVMVSPSWTSGEKAAIKVESAGAMQSAEASPLVPGSSSSQFLFNVKAASQDTPVLAYCPKDADVTLSAGKVSYTIPTEQTGVIESPLMFDLQTVKIGGYATSSFYLEPGCGFLFVNVAMGDYEVESLEISANGGEAIAGTVEADLASGKFTASASSIKVKLASPVSCKGSSIFIPVQCAPVKLSKGVKVKITTAKGEIFESSSEEAITVERGARTSTSKLAENESTELVFCGDNQVFVINASIIKDSYKEGIVWSWDAKNAASALGIAASKCDHLDDCKFVDHNSKLLLTSSYGWCALIEYPSAKVLFYTTKTPNAHSAEYIPEGNGYIAVATSSGTSSTHNQVQLYDVTKSNQILSAETLDSGHGVVWDSGRKLLYAGGGNLVKTFAIDALGSSSPKLTLKKSVKAPQGGIHDLYRVDDNTITVAGARAYFYNVSTEKFTEIPLFSASSAIKSLNYNAETGEMWYTDATVPEGNETWSSHKIRYSRSTDASQPDRVITVDIDMYKVRVKNW